MDTVFAVDLGKTNCRVALWPVDVEPSDDALSSFIGQGAPGLAESGGVDASVDAITSAMRALQLGFGATTPARVGIGVSGASAAPAAVRELAERLRRLWPDAAIAVASDGMTSHVGALGGGSGVVLAAGTGVVTIGVSDDGTTLQVDGWGPWLGDDGSGHWIGRMGLHAALAAVDGRGDPTRLTAAAAAMFASDLQSLPSAIGGDQHPVRALAAFAPEVVRIAAEGDAVAMTVLNAAADALVKDIMIAVRKVDIGHPVDTALTGGLVAVGTLLEEMVTLRLSENSDSINLVVAQGSSLDGAHIIAEHSDTVHEPTIVRICSAGAFR